VSPASRAAPAPPSDRCSIDEIIVFHALGQSEIRSIVELQPERVRRTAQGQGVELVTDQSLVDHRAAAGFRPEFGARELRRLIRIAAHFDKAAQWFSVPADRPGRTR